MKVDNKCPRCGGTEFQEHDKDTSSWDDDITYTSYECKKCGLFYHGWNNKWYIEVDNDSPSEDLEYVWKVVFDAKNCPCKVDGCCNRLGTKDGGYSYHTNVECSIDVCPYQKEESNVGSGG